MFHLRSFRMKHDVHSFTVFNEFIIIMILFNFVAAICPRVIFNENARKWSHNTEQLEVSESFLKKTKTNL